MHTTIASRIDQCGSPKVAVNHRTVPAKKRQHGADVSLTLFPFLEGKSGQFWTSPMMPIGSRSPVVIGNSVMTGPFADRPLARKQNDSNMQKMRVQQGFITASRSTTAAAH
jgi:hypothetical protein